MNRKKFLIWGTGILASELFEANYKSDCNKLLPDIIGFVDSNKKTDYFYDIPIYKPSEINKLNYDYIDIWVLKKRFEIEEEILRIGISKSRIRNFLEDSLQELIHKYDHSIKYKKPGLEELYLVTDYYRCQPWYKYAYKGFKNRKHCYYLYKWISDNVNRNASILEIACGAGGMLYHLCEDGFMNLHGYDYNERAINSCIKLNEITHGNIEFDIDNAYYPRHSKMHDVIVWTNGMYHLDEYTLNLFFETHIRMLNEKGFVLFDMIDIKYNDVPNNQYRTDTWDKEDKYPTEYKIRMSDEKVIEISKNYNLKLIQKDKINEKIPHNTYVFQMN